MSRNKLLISFSLVLANSIIFLFLNSPDQELENKKKKSNYIRPHYTAIQVKGSLRVDPTTIKPVQITDHNYSYTVKNAFIKNIAVLSVEDSILQAEEKSSKVNILISIDQNDFHKIKDFNNVLIIPNNIEPRKTLKRERYEISF